jgi:hypothetical protein
MIGLLAGGAVACGAASGTALRPPTLVDERSGTVDGVSLGDGRYRYCTGRVGDTYI